MQLEKEEMIDEAQRSKGGAGLPAAGAHGLGVRGVLDGGARRHLPTAAAPGGGFDSKASKRSANIPIPTRTVKLQPGQLCVMANPLPHEVLPITAGVRISLVMFYGPQV